MLETNPLHKRWAKPVTIQREAVVGDLITRPKGWTGEHGISMVIVKEIKKGPRPQEDVYQLYSATAFPDFLGGGHTFAVSREKIETEYKICWRE